MSVIAITRREPCLDTYRTFKSFAMSLSLWAQQDENMVRREVVMRTHVHHLRLLTCDGIRVKKIVPPRFAGITDNRMVGDRRGRIAIRWCFWGAKIRLEVMRVRN